MKILSACLQLINSKIKKVDVTISWTVTTPVAIISIYIFSTFLYNYLSKFSEKITYLGPQAFFLLSILFLKFFKNISFKDMGFSRQHLGQNLLLSGVFVILIYAGVTLFGLILYFINQFYPFVPPHVAFFEFNLRRIDPVFFLCLVVFAPVCEEFIFRGILFSALHKEMGFFFSVLLSAVIFMTAHLKFHPGALLLGLVTPFIYLSTRSVIPLIFIHAASNSLGYLLPSNSPFIFYCLSFLFK